TFLLSVSPILSVFFLSSDTALSYIYTLSLHDALPILVSYRSALRLYKHQRLAAGEYAKNVVLVGQASAVAWMTDYFRQNVPTNRYQLAGWLGVPPAAETALQPSMATSGGGQQQLALPRLGAVEDLGTLLVNSPLHEVIAVQSASDRDWLTRVIEDCDYFRVR